MVDTAIIDFENDRTAYTDEYHCDNSISSRGALCPNRTFGWLLKPQLRRHDRSLSER